LAQRNQDLGFALRPDLPAARLTVGERQQLEIMRLLSIGVQLLILDEPTTGISSHQRELLFDALKRLAARGKSILLVSHKLADVQALCDTVTVLRQGRVAGQMTRPFDPDGLLAMMFGAAPAAYACTAALPGGPLLDMQAVSAPGGRTGLLDCTVSIRHAEVVGLAGLEGSGQEVFLRLAAGLARPAGGEIRLLGQKMNARTHQDFKQRGVTFLPAARMEQGLVSGLTLADHFALSQGAGGFWIDRRRAGAAAREAIEGFFIKGRPQTPVDSLSGGNQQRLLLSLIPQDTRLLLMENPTRGLDVASVHWVWQKLCSASMSRTILFSSAEVEEILMVADRVLVFFEGRLLLDRPAARTDAGILGRAIAGTL
jgi:simple sugar transport system ATP-binding protein